jgi:hypothetical protein
MNWEFMAPMNARLQLLEERQEFTERLIGSGEKSAQDRIGRG